MVSVIHEWTKQKEPGIPEETRLEIEKGRSKMVSNSKNHSVTMVITITIKTMEPIDMRKPQIVFKKQIGYCQPKKGVTYVLTATLPEIKE